MINVDDRLLNDPKMTSDQYWLLSQITKRLGRQMFCFPSNKTLMNDTKWKIEKLQRVKKELQENGYISIEERTSTKGQSSNIYRVETELLGVFITANKASTPIGDSYTHSTGSPTSPPFEAQEGAPLGTSDNRSINNSEVLTSEVLDSESDDSVQKSLFGKYRTLDDQKKIRKEKADVHQAYSEFVKIWCEAYPELGFNAMSGKKIKSIITMTEKFMKDNSQSDDVESITGIFRFILDKIKTTNSWYHGKDLSIIESKYLSIIFEIRNGKSTTINKKQSARDFINSL